MLVIRLWLLGVERSVLNKVPQTKRERCFLKWKGLAKLAGTELAHKGCLGEQSKREKRRGGEGWKLTKA